MKVNKLKREIDEFLDNPKNTKQACLDMLHQIRSELDEVEIEVVEKVVVKEVLKEVEKPKASVKKPAVEKEKKQDKPKASNWF